MNVATGKWLTSAEGVGRYVLINPEDHELTLEIRQHAPEGRSSEHLVRVHQILCVILQRIPSPGFTISKLLHISQAVRLNAGVALLGSFSMRLQVLIRSPCIDADRHESRIISLRLQRLLAARSDP